MKKLYLSLLFFTLSASLFSQNYTVLGSATQLSGCNSYQLTPDAQDQAGAIFQNNTINLNNSFDYTFSVFLGCNGASGADGMCFVLTSNPNGLGNQGEGLGYAGPNQPYSLAVEFDTWQNGAPANDPSFDHIGIESGGLYNHNVAGAVSALTSQGNIDDCNWHTVRIVWDVNTSTYSVYFDGVLRQSVVLPNMVATYFGGNPIVNWGWTGSTGGGSNLQQVTIQTISNWVAGVNYQTCDLSVQFNDISTANVGSIQSWSWNFGDNSTSTQQNPTHTYAAAGTYTVSLTITDITGCSQTYSHTLTINPPITISPTLHDPSCNGVTDGSITVSASGGFGASAGYYPAPGYAYGWNGNGVSPSGTLLNYIGAGTYTVSATDGVCSTTAQYTLNQPTPVTATVSHTDANCGANNGSATIVISGGTPPYSTPNWGPVGGNGFTVNNLPQGTYIADFHDANGCSAALQYSVVVNQLPCGVTLSTSSTAVSCWGGNNGTATLNVTTGSPPAVITWSGGSHNPTITGLTAGNYGYTVTDNSANPPITGTVTVTQPTAPLGVSVTTINMSCANTNDGQALASVNTGGTPPYSYSWSGGHGSNASALSLGPGPITVTVTDANGCTATATGNITGPPTLTLNITEVDDSCYQSHTGSAMANVGGGNPPYTYYWSNISSAQNNLSLGIGSYTVTVTDSRGCTITGSTSVNQPTAFTHTLSHTDVTCNGASTGTITVTQQGGTPGYSYTWSPSTASGSNPTGLAAGQYNLTLTDAHNCRILDSTVIAQPTALSAVTSHTDENCYGSNDGTITITISGGTPGYTYQGQPIPGGTNTLTGLAPNTYSGVIADANGCTTNVSETVAGPGPQSVTMAETDATCFGVSNGTATATFVNATGTVTYAWSNTAQTTQTITNIPAGTYTVTATDAHNCTQTGTITVNQPPALSMTVSPVVDATCFGGNGSATANPQPAGTYTYAWSGTNLTTQTVAVPAGSYTVTASDATGCGQTGSFTINQPTAIDVQIAHTDVKCFGQSTGDITLTVSGGTPGYTYGWNPNVSTTNTATNLAANTYNITITDNANCTKDTFVVVSQPSAPLAASVQSTNVTCFGLNNGTIKLTPAGGTPGYTYTWNPNVSSTDTASSLSPNQYDITLTDANSCTANYSVTITQPAQALAVAPTQTDLTCNGVPTGVAAANASGGTTPYQYTWTPNVGTTDPETNLSAGNYNVTVTDNNGCTATASYTLTEPPAITSQVSTVDELCHGDQIGSITVTAGGGTPGYTYTWNPNVSTTNSATALPAGSYSITITDANSCTLVQAATINEPQAIALNVTTTAIICAGQNNGTLTATATGGNPAYNFSITGTSGTPQTSASGQFVNLVADNYTVVVTDQNSCSTSTTATVDSQTTIVHAISSVDPSCWGYSDGKVFEVASGGVSGFTYTFSNGATNTTGTLLNLPAGTYAVTVSDANNCTAADSTTLVQPDSVQVVVSPTPADVKLGNSLQITSTTNQTGTVTYEWTPSFGLSCYDCANPVFNGVYSQKYQLVLVNENGCTDTADVDINVIPTYDVFIPNAFTPNGDGNNDFWQLFGDLNGLKQVEVAVYNRIGEKVFESNNIDFKWDGTYLGTAAPEGVYVYTGKFVWLNNHSDNKFKGSITLLR